MIEETGEPLSLRRVLLDENGADLGRAAEETGATGAIDERLRTVPPGLRAGARDQILTLIARILDQPVVDVLVGGWRTWERLAEAARGSLEAPGQTDLVELLDHEVTSTHRPGVDVTFDGKRIASIEVELDVSMQLHAVTAVISGGRLTALRSGRADVTAKLAIEGLQVLTATLPIDLAVEIILGDGIELAVPVDVVTLPPYPDDQSATTG
jgi:hypothetical protein